MFRDDLYLPAKPETAVIETNQEIYRRLTLDVTSMTNDELSAVDAILEFSGSPIILPDHGKLASTSVMLVFTYLFDDGSLLMSIVVVGEVSELSAAGTVYTLVTV